MRNGRTCVIATGVLGGLAALRWSRTWGATTREIREPLPGDDIVQRPQIVSTRAVEIDADPGDVWPWLAQLGQGRGGLYSYQRLENLFGCRIANLDVVVPELQDLRVGDEVRLVPPDYRADISFEVALADPGRALVFRGRARTRTRSRKGWRTRRGRSSSSRRAPVGCGCSRGGGARSRRSRDRG